MSKPIPVHRIDRATPAMTDDTVLPFPFPAVRRKKVTAAFDGGRITSDGGVMLLAAAERRLGLAERLAAVIRDRRDPDAGELTPWPTSCGPASSPSPAATRTPTISTGCAAIRPSSSPAGDLPDSGADLCSQPTCRGWRTCPTCGPRPLGHVLVDLWLVELAGAARGVTLDIDDTLDVVHGHQQLSLFNAHYDERCFLPIHVYDTATGRPVAMILRPGKTPTGKEIRGHIRRLVRRIRRHWPTTRITIRGDGHYGRPEVMQWCEDNGVDYVFGLAGNQVLRRLVDAVCRRHPHPARARARGPSCAASPRPHTRPNPGSRSAASAPASRRRPSASISASSSPTSPRARPSTSMTSIYCARGQAENLIKLHKTQLASDRTSCRSPIANQMRLVLHTAAYWLMLAVRDAIPKAHALAKAEFATHPAPAAQDRRPRHRNRLARPSGLRRRLPRGRPVPPIAARCSRPVHEPGRRRPDEPHPPTSSAFHKSNPSRGEKDAMNHHGPTIGGTRTVQLVNRTG